jgi:hypothetical protein
MVGLEQLENNTERGIAGTMGVVLAVYGAGWGLATGAVLYFLIERTKLLGFTPDPDSPGADDVIIKPETTNQSMKDQSIKNQS